MKFKVGDRIVEYRYCNSIINFKWFGTVTQVSENFLSYKVDGSGNEAVSHPKQCRLLKKKERRRIWMNICPKAYPNIEVYSSSGFGGAGGQISTIPHPGWIEFIEVVKK